MQDDKGEQDSKAANKKKGVYGKAKLKQEALPSPSAIRYSSVNLSTKKLIQNPYFFNTISNHGPNEEKTLDQKV